jgi:hypothetical protein
MNASMPGYKFDNAHIRLGSKIHLGDFYYAEKLFVNSYYARGFAYMVFNYLKENLPVWMKNKDCSNPITLLCYGTYSSLLMTNLLCYLRAHFSGTFRFCSSIVEDIEGLKIFDEDCVGKSKYAILLIPIGATLTTSGKIRRRLMGYPNNPLVLGTPITCIVVGPKDEESDIVKSFWKKHDRAMRLIELSDGSIEKYFLLVESDWLEPHTCRKCFPDFDGEGGSLRLLLNEEPLLETNKVSVVPQTIFSLPVSTQRLSLGKVDEMLLKEHITPRHHVIRGENHFLYYINTEKFYRTNKEKIRTWLRSLGKNIYIGNKPIVMIAPEHNTNAEFANDVNDLVFGGTATLIHHVPGEEGMTNFRIFFRNLFVNQPRLFFVDDAVCTGKTLTRIRSLMQWISDERVQKIDVVAMINRAPHWFDMAKDFNVHCLISLNLSPVRTEKECFLCTDIRKYRELAIHSSELALEGLFRERVRRISPKEYSATTNMGYEYDQKRNRFLRRIKHIHELTPLFHEIITGREADREIKVILEKVVGDYLAKFSRIEGAKVRNEYCAEVLSGCPIEERIDFLKVIAYPHLSLYKNIKPLAAKLVLHEFLAMINDTPKHVSSLLLKYWLFVLKTIGKLNLNVLLRKEIVERTSRIIERLPVSIEQAIEENRREKSLLMESVKSSAGELFGASAKKSIVQAAEEERQLAYFKYEDIAIHYAAAVKEIVHSDEAKSFRFECELASAGTSALKELLLFENTAIFDLALSRIENVLIVNTEYLPKKIQHQIFGANSSAKLNTIIREFHELLANDKNLAINIDNDYRFEYLRRLIFSIDNKECISGGKQELKIDVDNYPTYRSFLLVVILRLFLTIEGELGSSIQEKMEVIKMLVESVVGAEGSFVTVARYGLEGTQNLRDAIVFLETRGEMGLGGSEIDVESLTFRHWKELVDGKRRSFVRAEENAEGMRGYSEFDMFETTERVRSLCTLAIAEMLCGKGEDDTSRLKAYGMITLYSSKKECFTADKIRMLMLTRRVLVSFLKKNYENDAFVQWVAEQTRRRLLLPMGHGFMRYLTRLKELFEKTSKAADIEEAFEIYHSILSNRVKYSRILKGLRLNTNIDRLFKEYKMEPKEFNLKVFFEHEIKGIAKFMYHDTYLERRREVDLSIFSGDWNIVFREELLRDVIFECILNAKMYVDTSKNKATLEIEVKKVN